MLDFLWLLAKIGIAVVAAVLIYVVMAKSIANFSRADPPPDPSEVELEDVDYRYRCIVCGAQVVLYAAPEGEEPTPPRHCREPMVLVTPVAHIYWRLWRFAPGLVDRLLRECWRKRGRLKA